MIPIALPEGLDAVEPDELAFVVVPGPERTRARATLEAAGLVVDVELLQVPSAERPRLLVPLERAALRLAVERLGRATWRWQLAVAAARLPFAARIAAGRRSIGLVARHGDASPLLAWLRPHSDEAGVVQIGSRGDVVVHAPPVVAKVAADADRLGREDDALRLVGDTARAAGADVPRPLARHDLGVAGALVETAVLGRPLAHGVRPARFASALERVADWLADWHRRSARSAELTSDRIARDVLDRATTVAAAIPDGDAYVRALEEVARRSEGAAAPFVATHHDLTSHNVLDHRGRLGIVDWEHARDDGLPLTDFFYAAADLAASANRYRDRAESFNDCFVPGRRWTALVQRLEHRLREAVGLSSEAADLCFHACWAHHAANELQASGGRPGEFVALAARAVEVRP